MNILNLSGGGTKIVGIYAATKTLIDRGYKPDVITGVSAGSYLALPLALGMFDKIDTMLANLTLDKMFDPKPVNEKGKITLAAIWRIVHGSYWIGDQTKSLELVREVVNPAQFDAWKYNTFAKDSVYGKERYPDCYVSAVDFRSGSKELINLRNCSYENALSFILGSGSIPFFTKGVDITYNDNNDHLSVAKRQLLFDGGLRNHIASVNMLEWLMAQKIKIDRCISVYARPEDYKIVEAEDWFPADVSAVITRSMDIMGIEISKKDEIIEQMLCRRDNVPLDQVFLPNVMEGTYDVDPTRLRQYAALAVKEALKVTFDGPTTSNREKHPTS